jgi:hypothetical protein
MELNIKQFMLSQKNMFSSTDSFSLEVASTSTQDNIYMDLNYLISIKIQSSPQKIFKISNKANKL